MSTVREAPQWSPVHDTEGVWRAMWRNFEGFEAPGTEGFLVKHGLWARGVGWALNNDDRNAAKLWALRLVPDFRSDIPDPTPWWRKHR